MVLGTPPTRRRRRGRVPSEASRVLTAQVVNPISAFRSKAVKEADESEDDFSVMGLEPLLNERPLYTDATAGGIALYFAPRPFNLRRGRTRRAFDVPLVNAWFKERCARGVLKCRGAFTPSTRLASIRRGRLRTFGPSRATAMLRAGPRRLLARSRNNFGASDHPRFCEIRDGVRRAPRGPQELRHFSCWYYCLCHL